MTVAEICACGAPAHPRAISNPPGLSVIDYRAGDFVSFRHALLHVLDGEEQLGARWRPGASGDLAVLMVEWWAYLADILTLYNERIAHQDYLRTADLPESVSGLIRLLGYRPRPGIGAKGVVAALLAARNPIVIPKGFQVQSKPGPGKTPQTFEVDADTLVSAPEAVPVDPPPSTAPIGVSVLIRGPVTTVKKGDRVLMVPKIWNGKSDYIDVVDVQPEKDPRGAVNTRVSFDRVPFLNEAAPNDPGPSPNDLRMLRGAQAAFVWHMGVSNATAVAAHTIELQNAVRQIRPGAMILLTSSDSTLKAQMQSVSGYGEIIWYGNQNDANKPPTQPPPPLTAGPPLPILHSELSLSTTVANASDWDNARATISVLYGWRDAGDLIPDPPTTLDFPPADNTPTPLTAGRPGFPPADAEGGYHFLIEDASGGGAHATASASTATEVDLQQLQDMTQTPLVAPMRALFGVLSVSRGESVADEVLGGGDATKAGQEFVLKKSPLTYLQDASSGQGYRSTLRVSVNGIEWTEVPSFYGQTATAKVFVTREDDRAKTHVTFGDWIHGSGLSSGNGNVIASYRIGSGSDSPAAGALTVVPKPRPGLKSVRNPVPVSGGADPDPADRIRLYAPRSVMTFGRAVSALDYETIAAQAPSVARARAYWSWDTDQQRNLVKVYVGDDQGAVKAAKEALSGAEDPNRPVQVLLAHAVSLRSGLNIRVVKEASYRAADIRKGVIDSLHDDHIGLFGKARARIGEPFFASQIAAACMSVPGVVAVHLIQFDAAPAAIPGVRWDPGEGNFWALDETSTRLDVVDA